ncbi:hypothetical protein PVAP13_2KG025900 [Panicum virgatum]|uniref:F-box domain-containing protein n=1 Tax=Panicum virgatum TaxID=38727 RepID=A0A8T0VRV3_PANVG|nr:hypothetical protein PVAP13_2KG025900 [Panicum virgatum]
MPPPPPLPEEIVEEVLVRFPPDDPASLVHAALVSKQWCRIICGARRGFSRRFRELHLSPPLLGFLCNRFDGALGARFDATAAARFVPTSSSFRPPNAIIADRRRRGWRAVHSGHGRVLLHHARTWDDDRLVVWDPITGEQRQLPESPLHGVLMWSWNAAVLCHAAAAGGGCNHLDCHRGPFVVIFVGNFIANRQTFSCVYSSETDGWSEPLFDDRLPHQGLHHGSVAALVGNSLYFMYDSHQGILKYDLLTQEMSAIPVPARGTVLMATEDGRLGLATVPESRLCMWSREQGPNGDAGWTQSRVIELDTLLPIHRLSGALVAGFADNGAGGVIFVRTAAAFFSFDLKSGRVDKVGESHGFNHLVVPYMSFCTPGTTKERYRAQL